MEVGLTQPSVLNADHELSGFGCGVESLDRWLRERALQNHKSGASRTYVVCDGTRVMGYYALASGGLATMDATGKFRRNMPDPIPVAILGRLAVDQRLAGRGVGRALFRDGALRVLSAAGVIGIRGLIVHAISAEASAFYEALGLSPSPQDPLTMMVTLDELRAALG
jgi:GNAT superfamily N-acetyltransferase